MKAPYFILIAIVGSLALLQVNQRLASPVLAIADRWLRWLVFAFGGAQVFRDFGWVDRPFPVLVVACFVLWFLGETFYNWLAISALSASPLPLFPRYLANQSGEEWPVQPRLLKVREWLRAQGFRQIQALKAEVGGGLYLRVSIYQDPAATIRLQITFLPQGSGAIAICASFVSITVGGNRYLTDNLYVPFGGFYPESWFVERHPCRRSLPALLRIHRARLKAAGRAPEPFVIEPLADLNETQHELDRLNTELGFLYPHGERADHGKITHEGRYRVWKEIWMLNYLGRPARYD